MSFKLLGHRYNRTKQPKVIKTVLLLVEQHWNTVQKHVSHTSLFDTARILVRKHTMQLVLEYLATLKLKT